MVCPQEVQYSPARKSRSQRNDLMLTTIEWKDDHVIMIDQRKLPAKVEYLVCKQYNDVINAIKKMAIRGAPAIGIAAAMGLAMGASSISSKTFMTFRTRFGLLADKMVRTRPTAVNLRWAVERMSSLVDSCSDKPLDEIKMMLRLESEKILVEDIEINKSIGKNGQIIIPYMATILTHCNAGSLATGGYGTALGVIRAAHEKGKAVDVFVDETRPWLQGLRLTAFELMEECIPMHVIADNAAGLFMRQKKIDLVITGADRIAANGDVANKIGTYQVAVLAKENGIPFYIAAPISTIDMTVKNGNDIPIEERDPCEITHLKGCMIGPAGVKALNPAFDITPARYVTGIITEKGIVRQPYKSEIKKLFTA
jgi:methylthioribose-1-phosphate isomerase